jgi:hypothetical protein
MDAWMETVPFASSPIRTPQTSVVMKARACWRMQRVTSLSMRNF